MARDLHRALEGVLGEEVPSTGIASNGAARLPAHVSHARSIIFLGTRVVDNQADRAIFWPLSVAPLDASVNQLDHTSLENKARQSLLRHRLRRSVVRADGLIFGSHYGRALYTARYAAGAMLPYAVISQGPASLQVTPQAIEADDGRGKVRILVCSHLDAYKGLLEFIDALGQVDRDLLSSTSVRIAGADREPVYAEAVRRRIQDLALGAHIEVASATKDELADLYGAADLFVFSSLCEAAGSFSLFDAFHAGLPVIASDRSSMPEICRGAAELVNPFETAHFSRTLTRLIKSREERAELAARSQKWSEDSPVWPERAEEVMTFIRRIERSS